MSWTAASQLKPSAKRETLVSDLHQELAHNQAFKIEPQCESLARINVWVPVSVEDYHGEDRQLGTQELLWQDPRAKWLSLIKQHCSDAKKSFVLLKGDYDCPWRLLCSKADVRSYFKAVCKVHKDQPLAQPPDVKRDCCMGTNVGKDDVAAAVLQQLCDTMVESGWRICPQSAEGATGACLLAKRIEDPGQEEDGTVAHHQASLSVTFNEGTVHVGVQLQRHEGKLFDLLSLLDGSLKQEWAKVLASGTADSMISVAVPSVAAENKALSRRCALDNAFSSTEPCQLDPAIAACPSRQHCCTVNFNADGSLWACVPASCLLTRCATTPCSEDTEAQICSDLVAQLTFAIGWASTRPCSATLCDLQAVEPGRSQGRSGGARHAPRGRRHLAPQLTSNLQNYLTAAEPQAADIMQQPSKKSRKPPTPGIAWLKNREGAAKPPNSKNVSKAIKRSAQTQPTSGTTKAAKASKGSTATKAATSKANKAAAQAAVASASAAGVVGSGQQTGAVMSAAGTATRAEQAPKRDRKKASDINAEEAVAKVQAAKIAGTMTKLSLLELKAYLKSVGKPVGGKKAELIDRIETLAEP